MSGLSPQTAAQNPSNERHRGVNQQDVQNVAVVVNHSVEES